MAKARRSRDPGTTIQTAHDSRPRKGVSKGTAEITTRPVHYLRAPAHGYLTDDTTYERSRVTCAACKQSDAWLLPLPGEGST